MQRKCASCRAGLSGLCEDCEKQTVTVQRKPHASFPGARYGSPAPGITLGEPDDAYEREADRLAAVVMGIPHNATGTGAPIGRATPPAESDALQRRSDTDLRHLPSPRTQSGTEETAEQAAPQEDEEAEEALAAIDSQMQRRTLSSRRTGARTGATSDLANAEPVPSSNGPGFGEALAAERGSGRPLAPEIRAFMEPRFGVDFSHVRVHTGPGPARLVAAVHAQAFTLGHDIYFGASYYAPGNTAGRQLIAHELVHTLQQNPRSSQPFRARDPLAGVDTSPRRIQRQQKTFVPQQVPAGRLVHETVLPAFGEANPTLFTEVAIPGATRKDVDTEKTGIADLYVASTTVALAMPGGEPALLQSDSKLRKGKEPWDRARHEAEGAPLGPKKPGASCEASGARVCRLGMAAPSTILLGDLKPASTAEVLLGGAQLKNYEDGLANTRDAVNDFIKHPNEERGNPKGEGWTLKTGRIESLRIPKDFAIGNKKQSLEGLRLYDGRKRGDLIPGLKGRMAVYKPPADKSGIWVYEWVPTELPPEVKKGKASKEFTDAVDRIEALIKRLRPSKKKGMKKPLNGAPSMGARRIQRKPEPFDHAAWAKDYQVWHDDAKKTLAGDKAREPRMIAALLEVQDRTKQPLGVTPQQAQTAKQLERVERWITWGGVFGRFRKVFGGIFIKVSDLYDKARDRLHKLRERTTAKADGGGDRLVGKIFKTAFKTALVFLKLITDRVAAQLKSALEKGVDNLIEEFFGDTYIHKLLEAKADLETKIAAVESAIEEDIQKRVDAIVKPYEAKLSFVADIAKWLGNVSKIVNAIRWAARVVQCLTPPGVGCLKLLLQEAGERVLEMVVETCWFQKFIVGPIFSKLAFFRTLPKDIADFILDHVKSWLPLDADLKEKLFPKVTGVSDKLETKELECDDTRLKREHIEMRKLLDKHGKRKVELLLQLMEKSAVGEKKELSLEQIKQMDAALSSLDVKQLDQALKQFDAAKGTGVGVLDDLVNAIKGAKPARAGAEGVEEGKPGKKPKHEVVVSDAANAKLEGDPRGVVDPKNSLDLSGTAKDHAEKSRQSITLSLFHEGELISQVTRVPTEVGKPREETFQGRRFKVVPYKLLQGVVFKHKVKGAGKIFLANGTVLEDTFEMGGAR